MCVHCQVARPKYNGCDASLAHDVGVTRPRQAAELGFGTKGVAVGRRQLLYRRVFKREVHRFKHLMNDRCLDNRRVITQPGVAGDDPVDRCTDLPHDLIAAQGWVIDDGVNDLTLFRQRGAEIAAMDVDGTHVHTPWRHEHVSLVECPIPFELREGIHDLAQLFYSVDTRQGQRLTRGVDGGVARGRMQALAQHRDLEEEPAHRCRRDTQVRGFGVDDKGRRVAAAQYAEWPYIRLARLFGDAECQNQVIAQRYAHFTKNFGCP